MGSARCRSVRFNTSSCGTQICESRPTGSTSMETQCVCLGVDVQVSVGISSSECPAPSFDASQSSERYVPNSSTEVAAGILESRSEVASDSSTLHRPPPGDQTNRSDHGPPSTKGKEYGSRNLEMWGWTQALETWSSQQKSLLRSGWRGSTLKTYKPAWERWINWCLKHNVDIKNPTGSDLAKYLADLHLVEKLAYRTILVHKSVVSTLCKTEDNSKLSSNILVKQILKAIANTSPKLRAGNIWDTSILISWLTNHNVQNSSNLWEISRRCAIILLLCSGRRIHDLTLLSVAEGFYVDSTVENSIVFWPKHGSKTDSDS
ncbi:uncharacterized protein LOC123704882 [Colias croceus]|uniref:uncharacterized protein LOC123704877 n=1 Tax=Colias crocea TaxID=72248 RepID=UPI001E27C1F6|nr:uncharacterized protein LOC123704877 [Colias croceus]XP_045509333.1 uncharacterized protein LOC123704882 [Colias croceus]